MSQWPTKRNVPKPPQTKSPSRNLLSVSPKSLRISRAKESLASSRLADFAPTIPHRGDVDHETKSIPGLLYREAVAFRSQQPSDNRRYGATLERADYLWNCDTMPFRHRIQKRVSTEANQTSLQGSAYHSQRPSPMTALWISKLTENCNLAAYKATSLSGYRI
jgi:hypothetical protein